MFSSPNGTTTFAERHSLELARLRTACEERGLMYPDIVEVGPGGVVSFLFEAMGKGKKDELSSGDRTKRYFVKRIETVLRRIPFMPLLSSESMEIVNALSTLHPRQLTVMDREERILKALKPLSEKGLSNVQLSAMQHDIESGVPEVSADIVVAYCVVERCDDRDAALATLFGMVRPGGLLSMSYKHAKHPAGFDRLSDGLYQRVPQAKKAIA